MEQRIVAFVEQHHMLKRKDKVVVGVSGGADSVCLFFVLQRLKEIYDLSLHIVHVNHQLRGKAADQDQAFVEKLGECYGVPVTVVSKDVESYAKENGLTEEEAGRKIRYEAFYQSFYKEQATKIAVAHNMNDNAETMLFHLARGTGMKGLCGVPPVRDQIIRPLLCVTRPEIEEYLKSIHQAYCIDATNLLDAYSRNRIRNQILPLLEQKLNAGAIRHMSEASSLLLEAQQFIEECTNKVFGQIVHKENGQYLVKIDALQKEAPIIQRELIRNVLFEVCGSRKDLENQHVEQLLNLLSMENGKQISLPYGMIGIRQYEYIKIGIPSHEDNSYEISIEKSGIYPVPGTDSSLCIEIDAALPNLSEIPKNDYTKWFDYDKISQSISLRTRRTGDYFQVNQEGGTKKIKDYFIDTKIPRSQRDVLPLLADGGHIIWILGDRMSEKYKISHTTKNILKAKIIGGKKDEY